MSFNRRINSNYAIFILMWHTLTPIFHSDRFNCHMPTHAKRANDIALGEALREAGTVFSSKTNLTIIFIIVAVAISRGVVV
jgi:hypothetical protein